MPMLRSMFGFGMAMIVARFQRWGIMLVLRAVLHMFVRYLLASGPRYLSCLMFMPSGPVELLFVLFEDDFTNFRKKNTLKWMLETFPTIHTQKSFKASFNITNSINFTKTTESEDPKN